MDHQQALKFNLKRAQQKQLSAKTSAPKSVQHKNNHSKLKSINLKDPSLLIAPQTAWPTIALFIGAYSLWLGVLFLMSAEQPLFSLSPVLAVIINSIAAYALFTVIHDASHRAVSKNEWLNTTLGRLSVFPLLPSPFYKLFRFVHMQHHRFTNEPTELDPDAYTTSGPAWQLPLRWASLDLSYLYWYLPKLNSRPKAEQREFYCALLIGLGIIAGAFYFSLFEAFLLYWILPSRIAIFILGLFFDYLPHQQKLATSAENPLQATNNRIGFERLMTPVLLSQNYHLIHHLYPRIPFYRYTQVWRDAEEQFKDNGALLYSWFGEPLSKANSNIQ